MTCLRRCFVLLSLLTLAACGSSQPGPGAPGGPAMQPAGTIEGNWELCGGYVSGEHRHLRHREKAYVMRFADGEFTVPFRGSEGERLGFPNHAVQYHRDGSRIILAHRAQSMEMNIVALDANTLRVQARNNRGGQVDLEYHRIDDQALAQLLETQPY